MWPLKRRVSLLLMLTGLRRMLRPPGGKLTASSCKHASFDMWPQPDKLCSSLRFLQCGGDKNSDEDLQWNAYSMCSDVQAG